MSNKRIWLVVSIFGAISLVFGLIIAVHALLKGTDPASLEWITAILLVSVLPLWFIAFWIGWWFGKVEARGYLAGIDKGVDALGNVAIAGLRSVKTVDPVRPLATVSTVRLLDAQDHSGDILDL